MDRYVDAPCGCISGRFIRIGIDSTLFVTTTSDIFIARAIILLSIHRNRGSGVP